MVGCKRTKRRQVMQQEGAGSYRKWIPLAGPFPTLEQAIQVRDTGLAKHQSNTDGLWKARLGGNSRRRLSQCAEPSHGPNCPVLLCIAAPRCNNPGYCIEVCEEQPHHESHGPARPLDVVRPNGRLGIEFKRPQKEFATRVYNTLPSATPKDIMLAFQKDAKDKGAKIRGGRNEGYEGDVPLACTHMTLWSVFSSIGFAGMYHSLIV